MRQVVLLGPTVGGEIADELRARDLVVEACRTLDEVLDEIARPRTRAAILQCGSPFTNVPDRRNLQKILTEIAPVGIPCGVAIMVIVNGDNPDDWAWVTAQADASAKGLGAVDPKSFRPQLIRTPYVPAEIAQNCIRHDPQRPCGAVRILDADDAASTELNSRLRAAFDDSPEDVRLLSRAFSDCDDVEVRLLQERRQGIEARRVYQVWPVRTGSPPIVPFIVKTSPAAAIESELGSTKMVCGDTTPFAYFPPVAYERNVTGLARAALVNHFIERAMPFEAYIETHSPAVAVSSLFDGPLRCWRSHVRVENKRIGRYCTAAGICSWDRKRYADAYRTAKATVENLLTPAKLLDRLRKLPARPVQVCTSHGDLHINNIFVRENSVDIVLIDFNRSGDAPASRDPAELEVSLAFTYSDEDVGRLSDDELRRLYTAPLTGRAAFPRRTAPRALAIEQVRKELAGLVSEDEYRQMVAGHLLWHAGHGNALAYELASRLLQDD